ncbi:MAG: DNA polymerase III subunit beta [Chloroflexi bacterium]|nr:DNA polymerase III subunit beta [Chloroflexota bacterium]
MRLTCQQEDLNRGLSAVSRAIPARTTLPITNHVLLEAADGSITLSATDAETIAITYTISGEVLTPGSLTLPSRLLSEFVGSLPPSRIEMTLAERSRQVHLSCSRNEASIGGMDPEEFPPIPPVSDLPALRVPAAGLRRALSQVVFAAATDDARPVLTGVQMAIGGTKIVLAAADGFRLSVHTLDLGEETEERTAIVPARALGELLRLLPEAGDETVAVTFNTSGRQAQFDIGHATLVAQLIEGTFPNYEQLIPPSHTTRTEVLLDEFMREARIASIFARDGSGIVRLVANEGEQGQPGQLLISARAEEIGTNEGEIDGIVEGEEAKIAFNGRYLTDVLQAVGTERVALETSSPSSPGVFRPVGDDSFVHVVMPMFVQWA